MTRKELIAKIRKCLALAKSANEHEAAAALAMAAKLAEEHDIDINTVEACTARTSRCQRPPLWETLLVNTVSRAMRCINYIECYDNDVRFVGRGADPEIAAYAFTVLRRKLRDARSVYIAGRLRRCRPGRKRQRADAYCEGWVMAIYHKVAALYPRVVPDGTIEQWLAANVPSLVAIDARSAKDSAKASEDRWHGHIAGQAVDLHAGMGNDSAPLAITDGAA